MSIVAPTSGLYTFHFLLGATKEVQVEACWCVDARVQGGYRVPCGEVETGLGLESGVLRISTRASSGRLEVVPEHRGRLAPSQSGRPPTPPRCRAQNPDPSERAS